MGLGILVQVHSDEKTFKRLYLTFILQKYV